MTAKKRHAKKGKTRPCKCDRGRKGTKVAACACHEDEVASQILSSRSIHPGDRKRKREESGTISDSKPFVPKQSPSTQRRKPSSGCGICSGIAHRQNWKNRLGGKVYNWIQCDMKACDLWCHLACVCLLLNEDPQSMVFSPDRFFCPKCFHQKEQDKKPDIIEGGSPTTSALDVQSELDNNDQKTETTMINLGMTGDTVIEFELVRQEKYNGFDDDMVNSLVRNLHQYIYDYDIEIRSAMERFATVSDVRTERPLEAWKLVDANDYITTGQQWFQTRDILGKQHTCHAPITAALRSMLRASDGKPLVIAASLKNLPFCQVHIGLVSWFVFDILDNGIDLHELPNMRSMRAMMTAVASAGEARWPNKGRHFLGEVQLRTWYKSEYQQALLLDAEMFRQELGAFMEPLTKDFDRITSWSHGRANIIEVTLRLWSYLKSLQGRLIMIQPAIGDLFDSKFHEAYDENGQQHLPRKNSKLKILWILCRGFRIEEDGLEESRILTIKARVIIQ